MGPIRYVVPTLLILACAGTVPAVGMLADEPRGDTLGEVPEPLATPQEVSEGRMETGQTFQVTTYLAHPASGPGTLRCVVITYGEHQAAKAPVATPVDDHICMDSDGPPLAAAMSELFVDPVTGEVSSTPQRFIYGTVRDQAKTVFVEGPDGTSTRFSTTAVADTDLRVFAGALPQSDDKGAGRAIAKSATGETVASQDLAFTEFAKRSEAEIQPPSEHEE